jgi:hypothetical protein
VSAIVRLKTSVRVGAIANTETSRLQDLSPVYRRKVVGLIRASVGSEYAGQEWHSPSGSRVPWKPTQRFGRARGAGESLGEGLGASKTLIRSGGTFRAWQGRGAGAIVNVTNKTVQVGVDLGRFPGERFLRGGTGAQLFMGPYISRPKKRVKNWQRWNGGPQQWAQWWYLFFRYGVTLSKATMERGLRNYARPHATMNPLLRQQIRRSVERYVLTGRVS